MKTVTLYEAFDGERFDSAEACRAHEAAHVETRLVGLTAEQVRAAITREDTDLADAIEEIGKRITKARIAAGDLRRGKPAAEAEGERGATPAPPVEAAPPAPSKLDEALRRAKAAGRDAARDATVPKLFAGTDALREAWTQGHAEVWASGAPA